MKCNEMEQNVFVCIHVCVCVRVCVCAGVCVSPKYTLFSSIYNLYSFYTNSTLFIFLLISLFVSNPF